MTDALLYDKYGPRMSPAYNYPCTAVGGLSSHNRQRNSSLAMTMITASA